MPSVIVDAASKLSLSLSLPPFLSTVYSLMQVRLLDILIKRLCSIRCSIWPCLKQLTSLKLVSIINNYESTTLLSTLNLLFFPGFCHRFIFDEFLVRYRHLSTDFQLSLLPNTRESVQHLLASVSQVIDEIDVSEDNFALGATKVFLK